MGCAIVTASRNGSITHVVSCNDVSLRAHIHLINIVLSSVHIFFSSIFFHLFYRPIITR